jgi:hypothetical protein
MFNVVVSTYYMQSVGSKFEFYMLHRVFFFFFFLLSAISNYYLVLRHWW